jgi:uncharacterized protein YdeI (BOF family)
MPGDVSLVIEKGPDYITTIPEANAAEDGTAILISGTVCEVNTAWSEQYGNITVTIVDADGNKLYVYRMKTNVALGDIITVSGTIGSYNGNKQVAAGSTAEITGHDNSYDYVEVTVAEALETADGTNVIVTGTVVEIATAYSEQYGNISVYIADENGVRLYIYRLTGNVEVGQIIKIKGVMATYKEARQVTGGTYEAVGTHACANYTEATCTTPAKCVVCGTAKDDVLADHAYADGVCTVCGAEEPVTPPTSSDEPANSSDVPESSDAPESSVAPESSDAPTSEPADSSAAASCFGSISGIAGGMMALGAFACVMLKKKEEDNE